MNKYSRLISLPAALVSERAACIGYLNLSRKEFIVGALKIAFCNSCSREEIFKNTDFIIWNA